MPLHEFDIVTITRVFSKSCMLVEALHFPEFTRLASSYANSISAVSNGASLLAATDGCCEVSRRHLRGDPELDEIVIELEPLHGHRRWTDPLPLRFPYVRWRQGENLQVARVPQLDIEVIARAVDDLAELLRTEILSALSRMRARNDLARLIPLVRVHRLALERRTCSVEIPTPRQVARNREQAKEGRKAGESLVGTVVSALYARTLPRAYEVEEQVARLGEILAGPVPQSVLLVGPSGVGKTAVFDELCRCSADHGLKQRCFWRSSGARLIAGMSGFGQWEERCLQLINEARTAQAILHLGHLVELMFLGSHTGNEQGMASFFRSYMQRGEVQIVVECLPEQLALIEKHDPGLLAVFTQLEIAEPAPERSQNILLNAALEAGARQSAVPIDEDAIDAIERLHRRFKTYSAFPGRPLRFLGRLLDRPSTEQPQTVTAADVQAAFSRETGLPLFLIDESDELDLSATRRQLAGAVVGQDEAITALTSLLAMIKTDLNRPDKPLASMLFAGPTGVGKTEAAKAFAEILFGDRGRLVRFDMSEYATVAAAARLTGSMVGEEGDLTGRIREHPFSLILLDEIEKAHPLVFDLLLQILGEGRLTDGSNCLADFTSSAVIMTSNLGARELQSTPAGFGDRAPGQEGSLSVLPAIRDFFRPELLNRLDRIVTFRPLDETIIAAIAHREVDRLMARDGLRHRDVTFEIDPAAVSWLGREGSDPRYGARALKRTIEHRLVVPLAEQLNRYSDKPVEARVILGESALTVDVRASAVATDQDSAARSVDRLVQRMTELRRDVFRVHVGWRVRRIQNAVYRLDSRRSSSPRRGAKRTQSSEDIRAERKRLLDLVKTIDALATGSAELEDRLLMSEITDLLPDLPALAGACEQSEQLFREVLIDLWREGENGPDAATIMLYGDPTAVSLVRACCWQAAHGCGDDVALHRGTIAQAASGTYRWDNLSNPEEALSCNPDSNDVFAITVMGRAARLHLQPLDGRHQVRLEQRSDSAWVAVSPRPVSKLSGPHHKLRSANLKKPPAFTYLMDQRRLACPGGTPVQIWSGGQVEVAINKFLALRLESGLRGIVAS